MFSVFRRNGLLSPFRPRRHLVFVFSCSTAGATTNPPSPKSFSIGEYLVQSCGLSAAQAAQASKPLAHLDSAKQPDAVLEFLRSQGFDLSHFKKIVPLYPRCLCWKVEKNLVPKFRSLRSMGFSESDIIRIMLPYPIILNHNSESVCLKLKMWESLFGSRELLLKHFNSRNWFFNYSIKNVVRPNLQFLKDECNISEKRVSLVVRQTPCFITQKLDALRTSVGRVDELGIPRESLTFLWALQVLYVLSEENFKAKHELMISLGWSESDFSAAVRKAPRVLCIGQKELCRKMEFLVKEVGYTPSSIARHSSLLLYSLDKRVIPRFRVMQLLYSKGLAEKKNLISLLILPPKKFMEKYILPHKENVPELPDIFETGLQAGSV